ncbi:MAG TPA: hypothetical protein VGD07_09340, partial [Methylomirabilota bacterium]
RLAIPALIVAVGAPLVHAAVAAMRVDFRHPRPAPLQRARLRLLIAWLHVLQPAARLRGRLGHGLTVWRRRGLSVFVVPAPRRFTLWTETWREAPAMLARLEAALRAAGFVVARGGDWDRWDLEVRGGLLGRARLLMAVEEHGHGKQLWRFRVSSRYSVAAAATIVALAGLAVAAALDGAPAVALALGATATAVAARGILEGGHAVAAFLVGHHWLKRGLPVTVAARAPVAPGRHARKPARRWPSAQPTDAKSA